MLATLCYLADFEAENFCCQYTLKAAHCGASIASGALPRHISLGTPRNITDIFAFICEAEKLSAHLSPLVVQLKTLEAIDTSTSSEHTCWLGFHYAAVQELETAREAVAELFQKLDCSISKQDPIRGTRNLTLLTGNLDLQTLQNAKKRFQRTISIKHCDSISLACFIMMAMCLENSPIFAVKGFC